MTDTINAWIDTAIAAGDRAYAPYSNYRVGALLVAANGETFTGCNVENATYPATICAERTALVKAISEGVQNFDLIVIATENGGSPCGICRQMLYEFAPGMRVMTVDFEGAIHLDTTLDKLLPHGFGPQSLKNSE